MCVPTFSPHTCVCACVCVWYRSQSVNNGERWVPHERFTTSAASVSLFSLYPSTHPFFLSLFLFSLSLNLSLSVAVHLHLILPIYVLLFWPTSFSRFYSLHPLNLSPFPSSLSVSLICFQSLSRYFYLFYPSVLASICLCSPQFSSAFSPLSVSNLFFPIFPLFLAWPAIFISLQYNLHTCLPLPAELKSTSVRGQSGIKPGWHWDICSWLQFF